MRCGAVVFGVCLLVAGCATADRQAEQAARRVAFLRAAAEGATDPLRRMLDDTPDLLDARDAEGRTALWLACREAQEETVQLLVERGADVNAADRGGSTPLHAVALFDRAAVVEQLLREAPPGGPAAIGLVTPLVPNADKRRGTIAAFLLAHGARVNAANSLGFTPLHIAALTDAAEVARALKPVGGTICLGLPDHAPATAKAKGFVTDIVRQREDVIEAKHLTFDLRGDRSAGRIKADREQLGKAIASVVDGAIGATPEGGRILLALTRRTGRARITLSHGGQSFEPGARARQSACRAGREAPRGRIGPGRTFERGDPDRHLVTVADLDVPLQPGIAAMNDLVDGERRRL